MVISMKIPWKKADRKQAEIGEIEAVPDNGAGPELAEYGEDAVPAAVNSHDPRGGGADQLRFSPSVGHPQVVGRDQPPDSPDAARHPFSQATVLLGC